MAMFGSRTFTTFHGIYHDVPSNSYCWHVIYVFFCVNVHVLVCVMTHPRSVTVVCLHHTRLFTVFLAVVTSSMSLVEFDVHVLASAVTGLCISSMIFVVHGTHSLIARLRDISVITVYVNIHSQWVLLSIADSGDTCSDIYWSLAAIMTYLTISVG